MSLLPDISPETITLHRVTTDGVDVHGDPIGRAEDDYEIEGVLVAPNRGPGSEDNVDQQTTVETSTLYLPLGSEVPAPMDRITIRDESWEVHGTPGVWPDGIEVFVRRGG